MIIKIKLLLCLAMLAGIYHANAQGSRITGKVQNANTGEPLAGATVSAQNSTGPVLTDAKGNYLISVSDMEDSITVSFAGMDKLTKSASGGDVLNFNLVPTNTALSDVVIIGYGQTSRKKLTTAISKIDAATIEALPVYRVEQVLQGNAPGITVIQNSGSPGSPLTVRLRGTGTAGTAQPLYIVDGLQVPDLNYLNPSDIESISILKDAAASAIYGARGGNGVVLVQTKTGKRNMSKPAISFDAYTGLQDLGHTPPLMNRDQYVQYYNDYANKTGGTPFTDAQRQALPNTNWYHEVFNNNVPMNNMSLSLANGGEHYAYYISGNIFDQKGIAGGNTDKSAYNRKNLTFNFNTDVFKNFKLSVGGNIVNETRNYLFENSAGTGVALMNYVNALPPIYPVFDSANKTIPFNMGDLSKPIVVNGVTVPAVGAVTNPFLSLYLTNNRTISNIKVFNISGTWKPIGNLSITSSYAYYQDLSFDKQFTPSFDFRPNQNFFNSFATLNETNYQSAYSQWEGNAKYNFSNLPNQNLELLAGFSVLNSNASTTGQSGSNFFVNDFSDINFALIKDPTTIVNALPQAFATGLLSYYGRVNYNYKQKYLLAATLRSDASSLFGPANRTGIFPSASAAWILSEESFLKNSRSFNLVKLRASWGINGNNFINPYQYSSVVNPNSGPSFGGQNTSGISIPYLANTNVKWEQSEQTDVGIDLNMFDNTLGLTVDYYNKLNSGVLFPVGTPIYTGYSSAAANVADVKNSGIEVLLAYHKTYNNGFSWNTSFNIGYNKNEVTSLGLNGQPIPGGNINFIFPDPITNTYVGKPIGSFYGYKVDHIDSSGNFVFKDLDKNGVINTADKTFIGSPFPDFTYGFTLGAGYKGFDVSAFLYGSHGNKIYDATTRLDASYTNRPVSYLDKDAPGNDLGNGASGTTQTDVSDFYVKNGSFAKLKTISLGYSLSPAILKKIGLSSLRIYATGQNLFVITKYPGVDPEIGQSSSQNTLDVGIDRGFYPQPKVYLFGIQAKF